MYVVGAIVVIEMLVDEKDDRERHRVVKLVIKEWRKAKTAEPEICVSFIAIREHLTEEKLIVHFFGHQKRHLAHITEPSNNDYDNDVSDNCDHNFGTFDDFGVKNDQKVSHNMILMSKYKGQHGGKKGQKIRASPPPPFSGNSRKKSIFYVTSSLMVKYGAN